MKRFLNLNVPGSYLTLAGGTFLILIPLILVLLRWLLNGLQIQWALLSLLIKISAGIGVVLLVILFLLIMIEQILDHALYKDYLEERNKKLKISADVYECAYCGNRKVGENDTCCSICGKNLI